MSALDNRQKYQRLHQPRPKTGQDMKTFLRHIFLVAVIAGFAGMSHATPMLLVWGGSWLGVDDGSALDANSQAGVIDYSGTLGNWTINVDIGTVSGSQEYPVMNLTFAATSTIDSNTALYLYFSDDNLGPTLNGLVTTSLVGAVDGKGTVSYSSNFLPSGATMATMLTAAGPFTGSFSSSDNSIVNCDGLYRLTEVVAIKGLDAGQSVSGVLHLDDPSARLPDGGTTALLLGFGLIGLSMVARKFKSGKA
jgi:hypothetical protein